jgi:hypothetical protein
MDVLGHPGFVMRDRRAQFAIASEISAGQKVRRTSHRAFVALRKRLRKQWSRKRLAPQVGLEATVKRKCKYLQSTDGTESTRKAVVVRVN